MQLQKIISGGLAGLLILLSTLSAGQRPYRDAAVRAARWISLSSRAGEPGRVWPSDPREPQSVSHTLYAGVPGVVVFFAEAFRQTESKEFLKNGCAGADYLLRVVAGEMECGLYEGLAGIGFALGQAWKVSRQERYRQGLERCLALIRQRAVAKGEGVEWSDVTDVISGGAGTGLFLLWAAREVNDPSLVDLAARAGRRLLALGRPERGGLKWAMNPDDARLMPNFSHGTAGVAYFLSELYRATKRREFLEGGLAGGRYLQAIARSDNGGCLIFHHEPDGQDLYYLGWCHGPAGTARLFYSLFLASGDRAWLEWLKRSARSLLASGIPQKETPGFWNNVGICCGTAGVAWFLLDCYRVLGDPVCLRFAEQLSANLLSRATVEGKGLKWVQAEHRVRPELLLAQTGLMQGAAGIGLWLLRLDAFLSHKPFHTRFPDSPF